MCSRDLVSAIADVEWGYCIGAFSVFVRVGYGVSVKVLDPWKVYCDILIEDLAEGYEFRLSTV
jgi:hypothetical protein